jgi:hypothetical protein
VELLRFAADFLACSLPTPWDFALPAGFAAFFTLTTGFAAAEVGALAFAALGAGDFARAAFFAVLTGVAFVRAVLPPLPPNMFCQLSENFFVDPTRTTLMAVHPIPIDETHLAPGH